MSTDRSPSIPFIPPTGHDPALQTALAELLQLGLTVARVTARLAEVEGHALDALAEASAEAARNMEAPQASLAEAIGAGQRADANEAARDGIAGRLASITASFDRAARAVRRTVALQIRLAEGRPFRGPPVRTDAPRLRAVPRAAAANDAERAERVDAPDWGDEIAGLTDADVLRSVRRDLSAAAAAVGLSSPAMVLDETETRPPPGSAAAPWPCPAAVMRDVLPAPDT